ncbi:hypothetical protein [Deinococcus sp. Leaf326]|uniref:hypothetical protein n=1 Tax=Deinococcus sp. Leaf326 TaxID=1736338 RepID=UPI0006F1CF69|nr:hypothetical protein [Deinococcus sp. Leaf326]KQR22881.1 hypothetical protein ASF71_06860 [Deinococcus sp. Leaf326]
MSDRDRVLDYITDRLDLLAPYNTLYATGYCDALRRIRTLITQPQRTATHEVRDEMRREEARQLATLTPAQDEGEKA